MWDYYYYYFNKMGHLIKIILQQVFQCLINDKGLIDKN